MAAMSLKETQEFWRTRPEFSTYTLPDFQCRSEVLAKLICRVPKDARILEIGCGPGRNLAYLADRGYERLEGVEISRQAIEILHRTYPQLVDISVHIGSAERILPTLDGPYDLIFTMAVLQHVHPESNVFDEIARLASVVLTIESRVINPAIAYSHDLPAIFRARGYRLTRTVPMSQFVLLTGDHLMALQYVAHRFKRR